MSCPILYPLGRDLPNFPSCGTLDPIYYYFIFSLQSMRAGASYPKRPRGDEREYDMQHYDLLVLVPATQTDPEVEAIWESLRQLLAQKNVKTSYEELIGKRRLAYRIKGVRHGVYASFGFYAENAAVAELHQTLRLMSEILRYQLVQMDEKSEEQKAREAETKARQTAREAERGASGVGKIARPAVRQSTPVVSAPKIREKTRAPELEPDVQPQSAEITTPSATETVTPSTAPAEEKPTAVPASPTPATSPAFTPSAKAKKAEEKIKLEELDERLDKILGEDIL
ncbi:MAG: 30S ribosomal protein S6 [Patescibacteria group bacterium]